MTAALAAALALLAPHDPAAALFGGAGPVPRFEVTVAPDGLAALRADPRAYVRGTVRVDGRLYPDVGVRLKGAQGSFRPWDDKPALTLRFDRFVRGGRCRGLARVHLNNSVQDPSYLNEVVGGELALAAGLPTARAGHALVTLNGRPAGLYVLKEGYDRLFLARHFADPGGTLYDGGFLTDVDADLRRDAGPDAGRADLRALAAACRVGDPARRLAALDRVLDVDRFLTLAAVQAVTADWDGYCRNRNNYRLYFDPGAGRAVFLPHGMDQLFRNPGEGVDPGTGGLVARALFETAEGRRRYFNRLREVVDRHFRADAVCERIDGRVPRLRAALEGERAGGGAELAAAARELKEQVRQRAAALRRELDRSR